MYFFEELNELRKFIIPCLLVFVLLSALFFLIPFSKPFSIYFLEQIKTDLLPQEVKLITVNPLNAFLSQIMVSFFLAFLAGFPFFLYKFIKYLAPALYKNEIKVILKILIPSLLLFSGGCVFSYFILMPSTFKILYSFAAKMGVETFFEINTFITMTITFLIVSGILFLLPIFMILLSKLGLIKRDFWKKNWRYAVLICLIFSAIITPDGTGITMIFLSLPLVGLYFLGSILA